MFTKIAFLGAASLLAMVTSATAYMGMSSKGTCCQKSAMVSAAAPSCESQSGCCSRVSGSVVSDVSVCECAACDCAECLPDNCCCDNGTCCADGACCKEGTCCKEGACDSSSKSTDKLVSTTVESCPSGCCAKK